MGQTVFFFFFFLFVAYILKDGGLLVCSIGLGIAKELARQGLDVVLVARNIDKLNKTSTELRETFGIDTKVIQADLGDPNEILS